MYSRPDEDSGPSLVAVNRARNDCRAGAFGSTTGTEEFAGVDVETELETLDPSAAVRAAVERRHPGRPGRPD